MKVYLHVNNLFGENTYVLVPEGNEGLTVVDPGMMQQSDYQLFDALVERFDKPVERVLLTHCHIDHVAGVDYLKKKYGAKVYASADDLYLLEHLAAQIAVFHLPIDVPKLEIDHFVADGDTIEGCGEPVAVMATPGHSKGCVSYHLPESNLLFTGDTLFENSLGRTDLPGGSLKEIVASIHRLVDTYADDTMVLPGHGDSTTIAHERRYNPAM